MRHVTAHRLWLFATVLLVTFRALCLARATMPIFTSSASSMKDYMPCMSTCFIVPPSSIARLQHWPTAPMPKRCTSSECCLVTLHQPCCYPHCAVRWSTLSANCTESSPPSSHVAETKFLRGRCVSQMCLTATATSLSNQALTEKFVCCAVFSNMLSCLQGAPPPSHLATFATITIAFTVTPPLSAIIAFTDTLCRQPDCQLLWCCCPAASGLYVFRAVN